MTDIGSKPLKAYALSVKDEEDAGEMIVFANTANEARKQAYGTDLSDAADGEWIRIQAHRDKRYDGMENLSNAELAMHQWRDGWRWFDVNYPDPDEATDDEFLKWYADTFGERKTI